MTREGIIIRIVGPVVEASGMKGSRMYESVRVGEERLIGEIIALNGDIATIQVYEETTGIYPGQPVETTGLPLFVELGPGLLGMIYDGIQRPLEVIRNQEGDAIPRGIDLPSLNREKTWAFTPIATPGTVMSAGDTIGEITEGPFFRHRIMVPPGVHGELSSIVSPGEYTVTDEIAVIRSGEKTTGLTMMQRWPVRQARPIHEREDPVSLLVTGQRVIDTLFPLCKGGTAAIPGPFGSGKTVVQQQLAKWVDADIIVYIGCGERGNEMADVLSQYPAIMDPRTGQPLINRMILIANTSNMPVAAREASIYTGITIAEYYRDMGYDVALMADSTSRWAEAMREISGRLEEMPGEEGYPAYLGSRLANFYERAGRARLIGDSDRHGSISIIGAVSPPGGDFSEPVTQNTLRIVKVFWALDADLAYERHFPAINWLMSYSLYNEAAGTWWEEHIGPDMKELKGKMLDILQKESELEEIIRIVGPETLPESDRMVLLEAEMIREGYLRQFAFHPVDTYTSPGKQYRMLTLLFRFFRAAEEAVEKGMTVAKIRGLPMISTFYRLGAAAPADEEAMFWAFEEATRDWTSTGGGS